MPNHHFRLVVEGADLQDEAVVDRLFEAGCDDALVGGTGGVQFIDFDRDAASFDAAVSSAVENVERVRGVRVVRLEGGELDAIADVATRHGRTREDVFDLMHSLLSGGDFPVVERFELPGRPARHAAIPRFLFDSKLGFELNRRFKATKGTLWLHQANALEALGRGENVVVSTGTASGKSLVFQAMAFHKARLFPKSRTLVFYPTKALAADQMRGWRQMASDLKLPVKFVGRIDGSVPSLDREPILDESRIIVMTPDVCHAWLMYGLARPVVRAFIRSLNTLVMDEAHTLEGVFGSNFAFLIRRLISARSHLTSDVDDPLQLIAATATIQDPGTHLQRLTGAPFTVVDHDQDGSPQHLRVVAHIECPDGEELTVAKSLHGRLLQNQSGGTFITFLDSRKGVETLAMATEGSNAGVDAATVLPYRAGYDVEDRNRIEKRLQAGKLKGVISTSALELGIDLPHLRVGLNVGVPPTRKSYRQRLGRIGRNDSSCFLVVAPRQAFSGFGTSFREYHYLPVEASHLYLDNRFMQFAHGRCLATEQESLGASSRMSIGSDWPEGFDKLYAAACPGGDRPTEFDAIDSLGGNNPHHRYPLRNVGELSYQIKIHKDAESIGEVNQVQALRECYPGGTYLHLAKAYEAKRWVAGAFDKPYIQVKRTSPQRRTRPRIRTWVNTGLDNVQHSNFLKGDHGFLTESAMLITQKVEGYNQDGKYFAYTDLQKNDPNLRAQSRNFRTTGVVLCIDQPWFKAADKRSFVTKLRDVFVREYSVTGQDVGASWSNISVQRWEGGGVPSGCVAIFDETYGSLRLTERIFWEFGHLMDRLVAGAHADEDEELEELSACVKSELAEFAADSLQQELASAPKGYEQVFKPGSTVCYRKAGAMAVDVVIIQPTIDDGQLRYQVKIQQKPWQSPVKHWISASAVEPSANTADWSYGWWNRETEEYEEPPEDDGPLLTT